MIYRILLSICILCSAIKYNFPLSSLIINLPIYNQAFAESSDNSADLIENVKTRKIELKTLGMNNFHDLFDQMIIHDKDSNSTINNKSDATTKSLNDLSEKSSVVIYVHSLWCSSCQQKAEKVCDWVRKQKNQDVIKKDKTFIALSWKSNSKPMSCDAFDFHGIMNPSFSQEKLKISTVPEIIELY